MSLFKPLRGTYLSRYRDDNAPRPSAEALYLLAEMELLHGPGWIVTDDYTAGHVIRIERGDKRAVVGLLFDGRFYATERHPATLDVPPPFRAARRDA